MSDMRCGCACLQAMKICLTAHGTGEKKMQGSTSSRNIPNRNQSRKLPKKIGARSQSALRRAVLLAVPAAVATLARQSQVIAATSTWTDGKASSAWFNASNWSSGVPGHNASNSANSDVAVIPISVYGNPLISLSTSGTSVGSPGYTLGEISFVAGNGTSGTTITFEANTAAPNTLFLWGGSDGNIISDTAPASSGTAIIAPGTAGNQSQSLQLDLGNATTNVINVGNGTVTTAALTISAPIIQVNANTPLTINLNGGNTITLSGNNAYSGTTTVSGGTLVAAYTGATSGSTSSTGSGNLTLKSTTLSSKSGAASYIAGTVNLSSGTNGITPGGAGTIGNLTIGGGLTFTAGTNSLTFDVNAASFDQIVEGGAITFGATPTIALGGSNSYMVGTSYPLLEFPTASNPNLTTGNLSSDFSLPAAPANFIWGVATINGTTSAVELMANTGPALTWSPTGGANAATGTWNINTTANWIPTGGGNQTTYADTDVVTFGDLGNGITGTVNIAANVAPAIVTFTNTSAGTAYTFTGAGGITGTTGINMNGNGTVVLNNTGNTYSGATIISGGTLRAGAANEFSPNSVVTLSSSAPALLDLNGANQTISNLSGGGVGNGGVALGGATLTVGDATNQTFSGVIADSGGNSSGTGGSLIKTGNGSLTLGASPTYSGQTVISAGLLSLAPLSAGTVVGLPSTTILTIANVNGAEFQVNGQSQTIAELSGGGATGGQLSINKAGETPILTVGDSGNSTFAGLISGGGGLLKVNSGSLTLSGPNSYTGITTISAGTLVAGYTTQSATVSSTGTAAVTLAAGTLASAPNVASYILGNVSTGAGVSFIAPGGNGTIGTLDLGGSLTLTGTSTLQFDINGSTYDSLALISAGTLSVSGTPAITLSATGNLSGKYVLATYPTSSVSNTSFTLPSAPAGFSWNVTSTDIELDPASLTWNVNPGLSGNVSGAWDTAAHTPKQWIDQNSIASDYASGDGVTFTDYTVSGNASVSGTITIATGGVTPSAMLINNSSTTYTFQDNEGASGVGIAGSTSVVKTGSGNATFASANSYTGGTVISSGTLIIADGDASLGNSTGPLSISGGTLQTNSTGITSARSLTVSAGTTGTFATNALASSTSGNSTINGTLAVTTSSSGGSLALNGTVTIGAAGALNVANGATLTFGQSSGTVTQASGGAIDGTLAIGGAITAKMQGNFTGTDGQIQLLATGATVTNPSTTLASSNIINQAISLNPGGAVAGGAGSVANNGNYTAGNFIATIGGTTAAASGNIYGLTINGNLTGAADLNIANGAGAAGGGSGYLYLNGNNTYTGATTINLNNGQVVLGSPSALPATTDLVFGNLLTGVGKPTLDLNGTSPTVYSLSDGAGVTAGTEVLTITNGNATASIFTVNGSTTPANGFSGIIKDGNGTVELIKQGNSTLTLTGGNNTYSGGTQINGGTIRANGSNSLGTGVVEVFTGGTLGGNGTIQNNGAGGFPIYLLGGTITAGANASSNGTLTTGSQSWPTNEGYGSAYKWKISGAGTSGVTAGSGSSGSNGQSVGSGVAGADWDLLSMSSLIVNSGNLSGSFGVAPSGNLTASSGQYSWIIAQVAGTGNLTLPAGVSLGQNLLTTVPTGGTVDAFALNTTGFSFNGVSNPASSNFSLEFEQINGNDDLVLDYTAFTAAPEPCTAMLVLGGVVPILMGRRRRRSSGHDRA
jgi:autotransporter-associated beta strand protein